MASGGSKISVQNRWDNEPKSVLIDRIKMLEEEVKILKQRMDELRKAKNQTIIKREHEYVEVGNPITDKDTVASARCRELEAKLAQLRKDHSAEISLLRTEKDKEISKLNEKVDAVRKETRQGPCGHEEELKQLRQKVTTMEGASSNTKAEIEAQKDIIDGLWFQLSEKEAEWCDKEEKMMYQFQRTLNSLQEGMSEKVAMEMQERIAQAMGVEVPEDTTTQEEADDSAGNGKGKDAKPKSDKKK